MTPRRIKLNRSKGAKLPPNTVSVARPWHWGNPARVGDYFMIGDPDPRGAGAMRMTWCRTTAAYGMGDPRYTFVADTAVAVALFRKVAAAYGPKHFAPLRGMNVACWCDLCPRHRDGLPLGVQCDDCAPCHGDVTLLMANPA